MLYFLSCLHVYLFFLKWILNFFKPFKEGHVVILCVTLLLQYLARKSRLIFNLFTVRLVDCCNWRHDLKLLSDTHCIDPQIRRISLGLIESLVPNSSVTWGGSIVLILERGTAVILLLKVRRRRFILFVSITVQTLLIVAISKFCWR